MTMLLRAGLGAALLASASSDNTYAHSELEWADVVPALSGLKVAAAGAPPTMRPLAPAFSSDQRAYTASVARSVVNISVLPTATCAGCLIDVCVNFTKKMRAKSGVASANVTIPTQVGTNLTIMVTAPWANNSGFSYANYSVNISKVADPPPPPAPPAPPPPPPYDARTDATLRGLSSNPGALSPEFDPHVFEYQLDTGRGALPPSVLIRAAPNSSSASASPPTFPPSRLPAPPLESHRLRARSQRWSSTARRFSRPPGRRRSRWPPRRRPSVHNHPPPQLDLRGYS